MDKRLVIISKLEKSHERLSQTWCSEEYDNQQLLEFCSLFIELVQALNPIRSYKLFDYIFCVNADLRNKEILKAHLIAASQYSQNLINRICKNPQCNISNEVIGVVFDYLKLLNAVKNVYSINFKGLAGSRNMKVDSYNSYKVANQIFWTPNDIQRSNTLNGYAIFALRQAIELAGKELIGLENILDKHGNIYIHGTQIPWDFIKLYQSKPYLKFSFNAKYIQQIFKWANHFVHTGNNALCYVTALALSTVQDIYQRAWGINSFGERDSYYLNQILDYNLLKRDFEMYLSELNTKSPKFAEWGYSPKLSTVLYEGNHISFEN